NPIQRVVRSTIIRRAPEAVFDFVSDMSNDVSWIVSTQLVTPYSPGPAAVGKAVHCVIRTHGIQWETDKVITEYTPNRAVTVEMRGGPVFRRDYRMVESVPGGTRFTTASEFERSQAYQFIGPW